MNLQVIKTDNGLMVDSRDVAEMIGREHKEILAMIEGQEHMNGRIKHIGFLPTISESGLFNPQDFFIKSNYKAEGNNKTYPCYLLTRKGCDMVANKMTGEKGVLFTATYVTKFEEMENSLKVKDSYMISDPIERAKAWILEAEQTKTLTLQLEAQRPKVIFAEALELSNNTILIGELAKILRQNGIEIGQNRLFEKLREDGYLISRKGESYNQPSQRSMELGLFEIKKRTINNPDGSVRATTTTKVTGKGMIYFVNKFKTELVLV